MRPAFSALMLGVAQAMVRDLKALAMTKTPRAAASSLRESPVFQIAVCRARSRLRACRAYLHTTLDEIWDKVEAAREFGDRGSRQPEARHHLRHQPGRRDRHRGLSRRGATAIFPTNPFERRMRDALSASQQLQGRPSNFITIGRVMLGLPPDTILLR